jgi:AcrR family transcriptional regulator
METRERIVAASREYFFRNGHRGVTMEELAEIVGVSKKTLYVYFPTKLAILEAVMGMQFELLFDTLESVLTANAENPVVCIEAVISKWQEMLAFVQPVFWRDVHLDAHNFLQNTEQYRVKIVHGIFGRIIRDGIEKGYFMSDPNPETKVEIMLAAIEGIVRSRRLAHHGLTTKESILAFVRWLMVGSLSDKGRAELEAVNAGKAAKGEKS